jgi:hypothetical protein
VKTQIIQLEPYDDIFSAKDKMGWGQTARVLVVWPPRGQVLDRRLDLMLLKRHSAELGAQLAIVTHNRDVRFHANQLGIPIYNNVRKAEKSPWRLDRQQRLKLPLTARIRSPLLWRRSQKQPNFEALRQAAHPPTPGWIVHPITRVVAFTLGVLAVLAIAALLIPSAEIQLTPQTQREKITISVAASPEFQAVNLSGTVPAQWRSVIVEGRGSVATTGSVPLPDQAARGEVVFTNLTDEEILIPEGTVVSTLGQEAVRFATTRDQTIPPRSEGGGTSIEAITPGTAGNVPAESILAIEGPLGLNLTVSNPEGTSGGVNRSAPAPSQRDYQELYEQLYRTLAQTAYEEIEANLGTDGLLISEEVSLKNTLEEIYEPAEPKPTDKLNLTLQLEFQALVASGENLRDLSRMALETNLPKGFIPQAHTLEIDVLGTPSLEDTLARWRMQAEWVVSAQFEGSQAVKLAMGLSPQAAASRLTQALSLRSPAEITLKPPWWPRLPILPFRITVHNQY